MSAQTVNVQITIDNSGRIIRINLPAQEARKFASLFPASGSVDVTAMVLNCKCEFPDTVEPLAICGCPMAPCDGKIRIEQLVDPVSETRAGA